MDRQRFFAGGVIKLKTQSNEMILKEITLMISAERWVICKTKDIKGS